MNWFKLSVIVLLLIMVVSVILFIMEIRKEQTKCLSNPLGYGIRQIEDLNNVSIICSCNNGIPNSLPVIVTRNGVKPII